MKSIKIVKLRYILKFYKIDFVILLFYQLKYLTILTL
jgi:hypothetical protein